MNISVIICTFNRCESLARTLGSLSHQRLPASVQWDVVVVDNNSTDDTRSTIEAIGPEFPVPIRYLFEARQGKSHALNLGISKASGDILAFTDDDVTFCRDWLHNLTHNLQDDTWAGAAGKVLSQEPLDLPQWFPKDDRLAFAPIALFDLGNEPKPTFEPPFGLNMAYRRSTFVQCGSFRVDLGPRGRAHFVSEDSEFGARVMRSGGQLRYEPDAVAYHAVPVARLQKSYILRWWYYKARSDVRAETAGDQDLRAPVWRLLGRVMHWTGRWWLGWSPASRFSAKLRVWLLLGTVRERLTAATLGLVRAHGDGAPRTAPSKGAPD